MRIAWRRCQIEPWQKKWGLLPFLRNLGPCLPCTACLCLGRGSFVGVAWWLRGQDLGPQRSGGTLVPALAQEDGYFFVAAHCAPFDILAQVCWGQTDQPQMPARPFPSAEAAPFPIPRGSGGGRQDWEFMFPPPGSDGGSIVLATWYLEHMNNSVRWHWGNCLG